MNKQWHLRIAASLATVFFLAAGCSAPAGGKLPMSSPSASEKLVSIQPTVSAGVKTEAPQASPQGNVQAGDPAKLWFYDENISLPLVLYHAKGLQFSMILGADDGNGVSCNATREADWQVENSAIATVSGGIITALTPGSTTISARYGKLTAQTTLTVFDGSPDSLTIDAGAGKATAGKAPLALNVTLGFDGTGEYPATDFIQVYNRNPEVAKVSFEDGNYLVYGLKAGKAEIIVGAFGLSSTVEITVIR